MTYLEPPGFDAPPDEEPPEDDEWEPDYEAIEQARQDDREADFYYYHPELA